MVKNLPAVLETWIWSLCQEDPLEKGMAREFHGQRGLGVHSVWDHKDSDMTEWLTLSLFQCKNNSFSFEFSSVQSLSHVRLFVTPWTTARQASLSITNSCGPPKPMSIESVMPWQPSHPLLSPSPPALNFSQHQGLFKWVSSLHQVAKVLEFQLQHQSFQWIFRTDFL